MVKKWVNSEDDKPTEEQVTDNTPDARDKPVKTGTRNRILKGNKLTGDIHVSCDLELSGDIEGNITSDAASNIVIKGACRGNISTNEGSVEIVGDMLNGNITAGKDIRITGKYEGGEVKAKGTIEINGEFNGKIEASETIIGPESKGTAEIFYKDFFSVARGASIEGQVCRLPAELKLIRNNPAEEHTSKETEPKTAEKA